MEKKLSSTHSDFSSANPCVSIITVCKNSAATIARVIESVLRQKENIIEYIILDGASTDGTVDIIRSFERQFDGKLRWTSEPDGGIYDAMNKGIAAAQGSLVGILNSDDWYEKEAVNVVGAIHAVEPHSIIHGLVRLHRDGKPFMVRGSSEQFLPVTMIEHPTCFVPRSVYQQCGMFDCSLTLAADYDFMLRCWKSGIPFRWEERVLANFSSGGLSEVAFPDALRERALVLHRHGVISEKQFRLELLKIRIKKLTAGVFS